jgi:hypothetical protein
MWGRVEVTSEDGRGMVKDSFLGNDSRWGEPVREFNALLASLRVKDLLRRVLIGIFDSSSMRSYTTSVRSRKKRRYEIHTSHRFKQAIY